MNPDIMCGQQTIIENAWYYNNLAKGSTNQEEGAVSVWQGGSS